MSKSHYIIPIFVPHIGCTNDCVFCNQKKITGQQLEDTPEEIKNKIESFLATMPKENCTKEIAYYGGSFTAMPMKRQAQLLEIAKGYKENGEIDTVRISTRPDCINSSILTLLKYYKVSIVELGVQSMDEEVLRISKRGHSPQDVINSIAMLKSQGFTVGVQVMIGLPGDNKEKCINTVKILTEQGPDIARIYPALVIKNTELEDMYKSGIYRPLSLNEVINIAKEMLILFENKNINVIRIGLQPTENILNNNDVVAGPFHPSMRQLVESFIFRDMCEFILGKMETKERDICISVNPSDVSNVIGQKKGNITYLRTKFSINNINIDSCKELEKGQIVANNGENHITLSKKEFIRKLEI